MRLDRPARDQLFRTWCDAFADYMMGMGGISEDTILARMTKNAVDFDLSAAAFDGDRMVGFTLVGVDTWQGERTAFDAGTGIVPGFRGQGLAREMFDFATPALVEHGVTRFLLEVLQPNEAAIRAYAKAGFQITRELDCFELAFARMPAHEVAAPEIRRAEGSLLDQFTDHLDRHPSWETSIAAVGRIPDEVLVLGAFDGPRCVGATAYYPRLNWLMGTVVKREYRRRGVATALVRTLVDRLRDERDSIRLINVDHSDTATLAFAEALGFSHLISQYEMELRLG